MGGAEASAQVPTNFALRSTLRDVVEIGVVLDRIAQLVVHLGELRQRRLFSAAGRVHDTSKGRRRPARTSDRTPALEVNGRTAKVGSNVRIATEASYDACNAVLIAGTRLVGTNVSPSAAGVVLLVSK